MRILALDIGSSSVKGAVVEQGRVVGKAASCSFATRYAAGCAEVAPNQVLRAISGVCAELGGRVKGVELLALCNMAPSWVAMDGRGRPLTPIITHQDRRSIVIAHELERRVGAKRLLSISGNRPFPGGISSTTAAWFAAHQPEVLRKAETVGHLNTFLLRRWTGKRVTDLSNASFMGAFKVTTLAGWSEEILAAIGVSPGKMPEVVPANQVAGCLTRSAAGELGLAEGTPVLPGIVDTSAASLLGKLEPGKLFNVSGSTDVLALYVEKPKPHPKLLTRALGFGRKWLAVSTMASAGTTISWLHNTFFRDLAVAEFHALLQRKIKHRGTDDVRFEPYLAGDRMSIDQRNAAFAGLTLRTTREDILGAALQAMARESAARLELLEAVYGPTSRRVLVGGKMGVAMGKLLHRDWPGKWRMQVEEQATVRGLYRLAESAMN